MERINLPVMCKSFRFTREAYGCEKHGACVHVADWKACADFAAVARAGTPSIVAPMPAAPMPQPKCVHLGEATGKLVTCAEGCKAKLKVLGCAVFGECTIARKGDGVAGCCSSPSAGRCKEFTVASSQLHQSVSDRQPQKDFAGGGRSGHLQLDLAEQHTT